MLAVGLLLHGAASADERSYPDFWGAWERHAQMFPEWDERMKEKWVDAVGDCEDIAGEFSHLAVLSFGMTEEFMKMSECWLDNRRAGYRLDVARVKVMQERLEWYLEDMHRALVSMQGRYGMLMAGIGIRPCG